MILQDDMGQNLISTNTQLSENTSNENPLILVVDDTPLNVQLLTEILSIQNYRVKIAYNGLQALSSVIKQTRDLILLDIMMPGMDGFQTCEKLKQSTYTSHIPIIFITARADTSDIVKGFEYGAVDYITKPFRSKELLVRVKTHLEHKRLKENLMELVEERTRKLQDAFHSLELSQKELIDRLGRAAEFRDNETG